VTTDVGGIPEVLPEGLVHLARPTPDGMRQMPLPDPHCGQNVPDVVETATSSGLGKEAPMVGAVMLTIPRYNGTGGEAHRILVHYALPRETYMSVGSISRCFRSLVGHHGKSKVCDLEWSHGLAMSEQDPPWLRHSPIPWPSPCYLYAIGKAL
jgi:hypothetical protein